MSKKEKRIAVLNLKGGTGKTTTATSIAYILAKEWKERVLLIDCDMQGNASKTFDRYDPDKRGTHTVMLEQAPLEFCITSTNYGREFGNMEGRIDICPANMYLMEANVDVLRDTENEQLHRLNNAIDKLLENERKYNLATYDTIIMDCALGLDMTVLNAIIASDTVIAPVPFGGYEVDGLEQLKEQMDDLEAIKPGIKLKALFTMRQGNKANLEFDEWLHTESGFDCYKTAIRRTVTVPKAAVEKMPVPAYSKNGAATKDYDALVTEIMEDYMEGRN